MRRLTALLVTALVLPAARAGDPPTPSLEDAVREAIRDRQIVDSDNLGDRARAARYRELVDGAVLVGFEVGLAKVGDRDVPFAFRPIYRDGDRDWPGQPAGDMYSRHVRRTVKVVAKPDYVVGGMWVRSGNALDRLCLNYVRARDGGVDPTDHYPSEWVGTSDGGTETYISGRGRPVIGVFADVGGEQVRGVGLTFARIPPPPPKKALVEAPPPDAAEPGGKTKLELEAEAQRERDQQQQVPDDGTSLMLVLVPVGLIAVPAAVVGVFLLGGGRGSRRGPHADRAARPTPEFEGQPLSERPELARRVEPYLPAARGRKRRSGAPAAGGAPRPEAGVPKPVVVAESKPVEKLPTPPPDESPLFFMVRATYKTRHNRMTRIYVLENEMLVIDAGSGADVNQVAGVAAAAASGGGILGAMIGGAVGSMVADGQKAKGEAFARRLDQLDLGGLIRWAGEAGNFRAKFTDVVGLSIDPPARGMWRERTRGVGVFRFRHLQRGEFSFEFLIGAEIRGAIELIRRSAGGASLHIGEGWDEATAAYLVGL